MPGDEARSDEPMWHERVASDQRDGAVSTSPDGSPPDSEVTAIIDRAARIGVPAWRVTIALGLPPGDG
jgi:hypothetical protein